MSRRSEAAVRSKLFAVSRGTSTFHILWQDADSHAAVPSWMAVGSRPRTTAFVRIAAGGIESKHSGLVAEKRNRASFAPSEGLCQEGEIRRLDVELEDVPRDGLVPARHQHSTVAKHDMRGPGRTLSLDGVCSC